MKNKIITILLATILSCLIVGTVWSIDLGTGQDSLLGSARQSAGYAEADDKALAGIIGTIIKAVLSLVGVMFTFLMAYAGDLWMTARGDQEKIDKAKKIITGSILGLVVTLAAYTISNFAVKAILERTTGTTGDSGAGAAQEGQLEDGQLEDMVDCCEECRRDRGFLDTCEYEIVDRNACMGDCVPSMECVYKLVPGDMCNEDSF